MKTTFTTALTTLPTCHRGKFRHASISARQQSLQCGHNLRRPFLRATLADDSWIVRSSDGGNGETKGIITPQPRRVSAQLLYTFVSLHDSDREGVVRIFVALSCELGGFFI